MKQKHLVLYEDFDAGAPPVSPDAGGADMYTTPENVHGIGPIQVPRDIGLRPLNPLKRKRKKKQKKKKNV